MPRTPTRDAAQLDREIAGAIKEAGASAEGGNYYYVTDRAGRRTLYGPHRTRRDAEIAGYFHKPVADRDSTPLNLYVMRGVQEYDEAEIASLTKYPEEWGLKSAKLMRRAPPMHASWKAFDAEFRQHLLGKDLELADRLMARRS